MKSRSATISKTVETIRVTFFEENEPDDYTVLGEHAYTSIDTALYAVRRFIEGEQPMDEGAINTESHCDMDENEP